jgi:hypothetical protein
LKVVHQKKILEDRTKGRACLFEGLGEYSSPKSSAQTIAKSLEKDTPDTLFRFQGDMQLKRNTTCD